MSSNNIYNIYSVYDTVAEEVVGYFDSKESILIGIYKYLRSIYERSDNKNEQWSEHYGLLNEFAIEVIKINENIGNENKLDIEITDDEFIKMMIEGPREIILKKLLDE